ncbi:Ppx/GppA family phosphatase [Sphingomonas flavalba]|uniref:Ppx/GppA phosphatase family protein n=1 Tax=Sphingomonas flavalba TaxID=2559804 RepID=UPI0039DF59E5
MGDAGVEPGGPAARRRSAIIDIGSNSVRLVVFDGHARIPAVLFNEKVLAGLGRSLAETGAIEPAAMDMAMVALTRFRGLCDAMGIASPRAVATAAVRDASNGPVLIDRIEQLGFAVELLPGEQEATAAALGVASGIPDADGIVGDLGGGSLELVRLKRGVIDARASFPLGVLRVGPMRETGQRAFARAVSRQLATADWLEEARGLPFYLVGGSWRALARFDMHLSGHPLRILQQYRMQPETAARMVRVLAHIGRSTLKSVPALPAGRVATLETAAAMLAALVRHLSPSDLVVSAFGLREGLLYQRMSAEERAQDPLIVACRDEGERGGRFAEHGDLLDQWIAPLFGDETPTNARIRHAACLLADVGWRANPEFKAERALEIGLHGNWVAIEPHERVMLGQALYSSSGGSGILSGFERLCDAEDLRRAMRWGLAIRLGQRFSGAAAGPLRSSRVAVVDGVLVLEMEDDTRIFYGEAVARRHRQLASALGVNARLP